MRQHPLEGFLAEQAFADVLVTVDGAAETDFRGNLVAGSLLISNFRDNCPGS